MFTTMFLPSLAFRRAGPLVTRRIYPGRGSMRFYSDRPEDGIKVRSSERGAEARLILLPAEPARRFQDSR